MIRDMLRSAFPQYWSFGDRRLAAIMAVLMLALIGLMGWLALIVIDSANIAPTKTIVTVVETKEVVPAHTTTMVVFVGKAALPTMTYNPKSYHLHFKITGKELDFAAEKKFFDEINTGDKIEVDYGLGRISGDCIPMKIRSAH